MKTTIAFVVMALATQGISQTNKPKDNVIEFSSKDFAPSKDSILKEAKELSELPESERNTDAYVNRYMTMLKSAAKIQSSLGSDGKRAVVEVPEPTEAAEKRYNDRKRALEQKRRERIAELDQLAASNDEAKKRAEANMSKDKAWIENKAASRKDANQTFDSYLSDLLNKKGQFEEIPNRSHR